MPRLNGEPAEFAEFAEFAERAELGEEKGYRVLYVGRRPLFTLDTLFGCGFIRSIENNSRQLQNSNIIHWEILGLKNFLGTPKKFSFALFHCFSLVQCDNWCFLLWAYGHVTAFNTFLPPTVCIVILTAFLHLEYVHSTIVNRSQP